ncbi:zeta toxin family protein [Pseudonocardia eucalypti]|uniref:zeta toxin family protein n=1 Tax=Pseudonocardia eucalypti TaxID=648755 RepID=UPI0031EA8EA9
MALRWWSDAHTRAVLKLLRAWKGPWLSLDDLTVELPRGPPGVRVLILDGEFPVPGVVAFGWAAQNAVVITRAMAEEIAAHIAAGRLPADFWWRLLEHERDFHLPGGKHFRHTEHQHAADADPLAEEIHAARTERYQLGAAENERVFREVIVPEVLSGVTPGESLEVVFLVGQSGAGKTTVKKQFTERIGGREHALAIDADSLRQYHPEYRRMMARDDVHMTRYSDPDRKIWAAKLHEYVREHGLNLVFESGLQRPEVFVELARTYRAAGYRVTVVALGVPEAMSRQGVLARYYEQVRATGHGRLTAAAREREQGFLGTLVAAGYVDELLLADEMFVYRRGETDPRYHDVLVHSGDQVRWRNGPGLRNAIERERDRKLTKQEANGFRAKQRWLRKVARPEHAAAIAAIDQLARPILPSRARLALERFVAALSDLVRQVQRTTAHEEPAVPAPTAEQVFAQVRGGSWFSVRFTDEQLAALGWLPALAEHARAPTAREAGVLPDGGRRVLVLPEDLVNQLQTGEFGAPIYRFVAWMRADVAVVSESVLRGSLDWITLGVLAEDWWHQALASGLEERPFLLQQLDSAEMSARRLERAAEDRLTAFLDRAGGFPLPDLPGAPAEHDTAFYQRLAEWLHLANQLPGLAAESRLVRFTEPGFAAEWLANARDARIRDIQAWTALPATEQARALLAELLAEAASASARGEQVLVILRRTVPDDRQLGYRIAEQDEPLPSHGPHNAVFLTRLLISEAQARAAHLTEVITALEQAITRAPAERADSGAADQAGAAERTPQGQTAPDHDANGRETGDWPTPGRASAAEPNDSRAGRRWWSRLLRWLARIGVVVGVVAVALVLLAQPAWAVAGLAGPDWHRLAATGVATVFALAWAVGYRLRGRSPPDAGSPSTGCGLFDRIRAAVRLDGRLIVGLLLFGGLFGVGTLGVSASAFGSVSAPPALAASLLGGTAVVGVALTAHVVRIADPAGRTARVPVRVALAAAALAGTVVELLLGPALLPISAALVAAAVAEGALFWAGRRALAAPPAAPEPAIADNLVPTEVPDAVKGTPLAAQWPHIGAARAARKALTVLAAGAAVGFFLSLHQLTDLVEAALPPAGNRINVGDLVAALIGTNMIAGVVNYARTVVGTTWPTLLVISAERVSTPRLLARVGAGIGLATAGLGVLFAGLYLVRAGPAGPALARHAVAGALIGVGTAAVGLAAMAGVPMLGPAIGLGVGALVGLTTLAELPLDARRPVRTVIAVARALPRLPVLLARRLLDVPDAVRDVYVLVKLYARFARSTDARLPLTEADLADRELQAVTEANPRYVIRDGQLIDTYRLWLDWSTLTELPADLTELQRRSARAAVEAGLTRGETARLLGMKRRVLRRWLREQEAGPAGPHGPPTGAEPNHEPSGGAEPNHGPPTGAEPNLGPARGAEPDADVPAQPLTGGRTTRAPTLRHWLARFAVVGSVVLALLVGPMAGVAAATAIGETVATATAVPVLQAADGLPAATSVDGATLLVAAVAAVVVTAVAEKVWNALVQGGERASAAVQARMAWLLARAGRLVAGVFTGFGLAALADDWLVAGPIFWAGAVMAVGDLILRLMPNAILRDIGKAWTAANPPIRLFGAGAAFGAFWWLHAMAPTTQVWALPLPIAAVATLAGGITALVHWRHEIGTALHTALTALIRQLNVAYLHAEQGVQKALSSPAARAVRRWFPTDRTALLAGALTGIGTVLVIGHALTVLATAALLVAIAALTRAVAEQAGWQGGWSQRGPPLLTRVALGTLLGAAVAALLLGTPAYAATPNAATQIAHPTLGLILLIASGVITVAVITTRTWNALRGRAWRKAEVARLTALDDEAWSHAIKYARKHRNQEPEDLRWDLRDAERTGVIAYQVGTPEATKILARHRIVLWALRADGTLWVSRAFGYRNGKTIWIKHVVPADGGPVIASGNANAEGGRGRWINTRSGHFHRGISKQHDRTARAFGEAAFARHGITFPGNPLGRLFRKHGGGSGGQGGAGATDAGDHGADPAPDGGGEVAEFRAGRPAVLDESRPTRGPPLWQRILRWFQRLVTSVITAVLGVLALAVPSLADTGTQPATGTADHLVILGVGVAIVLATVVRLVWRHVPAAVAVLGVAVATITGAHVAGIGQLSPVGNTVSGYVAAPDGFTFLAVGMVAMAAAVELVRLAVRTGTLTRVLLRLSSAALVLVAVFPTVPNAPDAFSSRMHLAAAAVLFVALPWAGVRLAGALHAGRTMRTVAWAFVGTAAATIIRSLLTTIDVVGLPAALSLGIIERIALAVGVVTVGLAARPLPRAAVRRLRQAARWTGRLLARAVLVIALAGFLLVGPFADHAYAADYYPTISVLDGLPTALVVTGGALLAAAVAAVLPFVRWWWRLRPTRGPPGTAPKLSFGALRLAVPLLYLVVLAPVWGGLIWALGPFASALALIGTMFGAFGISLVRDRFGGDIRSAEYHSEHAADDPREREKAQRYLRDAVGRLLVWPFGSRLTKDPAYWYRALAVGEQLSGQPATDRPARSLRRWTVMAALLLAFTGVLRTAAPPAPIALPTSAVVPAHASEQGLAAQFTRAGFVERVDPQRGPLLVLPDPRGDLVVGAMPDQVMTLTDELRSLTYTIEHKAYLNESYWPSFRPKDESSAGPAEVAEAWHNRPDRPRASADGFDYTISPDAQKDPIGLLTQRTPVGAGLIQSQPVDPGYAESAPRLPAAGHAGATDVLARAIPAVVRLRLADGSAVGSGVIIDPNGTILTAAHVTTGDGQPIDLVAELRDGRSFRTTHIERPDGTEVGREVQRRHPGLDLPRSISYWRTDGDELKHDVVDIDALRIDRGVDTGRPDYAKPLPYVRMAPTRPAEGEPVIAVGYPGVEPDLQQFALSGGPTQRGPDPLEFSYFGWSTRGFSGGALFNTRGELIAPLTKSEGSSTVTGQSGPEFARAFAETVTGRRNRTAPRRTGNRPAPGAGDGPGNGPGSGGGPARRDGPRGDGSGTSPVRDPAGGTTRPVHKAGWARRLARAVITIGAPAGLLLIGPFAGTAYAADYCPTVSPVAGLPTALLVTAGVLLVAAVRTVMPFLRWWWRLHPTRGPPDTTKLGAPKVGIGALRLAVPVLYAPVLVGFWWGLITLLGPAGGLLALVGTAAGAVGLTMVRDRFGNDVYYAEFYSERGREPADRDKARRYLHGGVGRLLLWPFGSRVLKGPRYWSRALGVTEELTGRPAAHRPARSVRRWAVMVALLLSVTSALEGGARLAPVALPSSVVIPAHDAETRLATEFTQAGFVERVDPQRGPLLVLPDPRGDLVVGAMPDQVMTLTDELRSLTYTIEHKAYLDERYWPDSRRRDETAATPAQIAQAWHTRDDTPRASADGIDYYISPDQRQPIALLTQDTPVGAGLIQSQPLRASDATDAPRLDAKPGATPTDALERAIPAVVRLRAADGTSVGSGVIIDPNGTILTAAHVTTDDGETRELVAELRDGRSFRTRPIQRPEPNEVSARIGGTDRAQAYWRTDGDQESTRVVDIDALRIDRGVETGRPDYRKPLPYIPMARTAPAPGEPVIAIGYPGITAARQQFALAGGPVIKTSNPLNLSFFGWATGGFSGGAIVNARGELVVPLTNTANRGPPTVTGQSGPEFARVFAELVTHAAGEAR